MLRHLLLTVLLFSLFTPEAPAQRRDNLAGAMGAYEDGVNFLLAGKAKKASRSFTQAIKLDTGFVAAYRFQGIAFELLQDYPAAAAAYQEVLKRNPYFSRLLYYQLGMAYYRMSRPKVALHYLEQFRDLQEEDLGVFGRNGEEEAAEEQEVLLRLESDIRSAKITQDSTQFINVTEISNLGAPINSPRLDLFPFFSSDRKELIFTRRESYVGDEDFLRGRRRDLTGKFTIVPFISVDKKLGEGMLSIVRDGERIYFTVCSKEEEGGGCDLFTGILRNNKIQVVEPLPDYVNSPSWDSQAAISCDGQQLFFASFRPGGVGGSDIYTCRKMPDGSWSTPKNLGTGVNTPYDEEAPFLSDDGNTLYFTSNGHYSLGDTDIFMSWWDRVEERWTRAINLGPPVNGPHRELGFHLSSDGRTGYVASDRPGGLGDLDIYTFQLADRLSSEPITYVSGYVSDSLTGEPIANFAVPVADGATYYTNDQGRFFICASSEGVLPLSIDHPEYLPYQRDFAIPSWENLKPYRIDLLLQKEIMPPVEETPEEEIPEPMDSVTYVPRLVKPSPYIVRFNFDDASLTVREIEGIEKFVERMKDKNIDQIIITGYTDEVGDKGYNYKLSQQRAKAVGIHLQGAGLKANEINIVGLGEIQGALQRALNSKVEIQITYTELVEIRN
jgi:outer membrane protein OmpA-like peptidoglycan-associated protein